MLSREEARAELKRRGLPMPEDIKKKPLSREEATAELRRLGLPMPEELQKKALTREEARAELRRRGLPMPEELNNRKTFFPQSVESAMIGFNTPFEELAHGTLQPVFENLLGNTVAQSSRNVASQREADYAAAKASSPLSAMGGYGLGTIAQSIPAIYGGPIGAEAALGRISPYMKYLSGILGTAGAGALQGGAQYVNPEDSRLVNALKGSALNLGVRGVGQAAKGVYGLGKAISKTHPPEKFTKNFLKDMSEAKEIYNKGYGRWESEIEASGIKNLEKMPKINYSDIFNKASKDEKKYLKNFMQDPSIENAHRAQSDLGEMIARLKGLKQTNAVKDARRSAEKAQLRLRKEIKETLKGSGREDLASEYGTLTTGYKRDVIPYTTNPTVRKYLNEELTDEGFLKKISKSEPFKKKIGQEKYPELYKRQNALKAIGSVPGIIGGYEIYNFLRGHQ